MSYKPYVPRYIRIINGIRSQARYLLLNHPECTMYASTFGVLGLSFAFYKMYKYGLWEGVQPYYRNYYHVVRPDSEVALKWRVPEDYPATYLSNRENRMSSTYKVDYAYD